jgi:hypothetical protein
MHEKNHVIFLNIVLFLGKIYVISLNAIWTELFRLDIFKGARR